MSERGHRHDLDGLGNPEDLRNLSMVERCQQPPCPSPDACAAKQRFCIARPVSNMSQSPFSVCLALLYNNRISLSSRIGQGRGVHRSLRKKLDSPLKEQVANSDLTFGIFYRQSLPSIGYWPRKETISRPPSRCGVLLQEQDRVCIYECSVFP